MVVHIPNKVYIEPGKAVHKVTQYAKSGERDGRRWWTDRVYSDSGRFYLSFFADNADALPETFSEYRIRSVRVEFGFRKRGNGFCENYAIYCVIDPIDLLTEPPADPIEDDELPYEDYEVEEWQN